MKDTQNTVWQNETKDVNSRLYFQHDDRASIDEQQVHHVMQIRGSTLVLSGIVQTQNGCNLFNDITIGTVKRAEWAFSWQLSC